MLMVSVHHPQMVALWHLAYHHIPIRCTCNKCNKSALHYGAGRTPWPGSSRLPPRLGDQENPATMTGPHFWLAKSPHPKVVNICFWLHCVQLCSWMFMAFGKQNPLQNLEPLEHVQNMCSWRWLRWHLRVWVWIRNLVPCFSHQNGYTRTVIYIYICIHQNSWLFLVLITSQLRGT